MLIWSCNLAGPEGVGEYNVITLNLPSLPNDVEGRAQVVRDAGEQTLKHSLLTLLLRS